MITMVAGSLPGIVTSGSNRRINKEGIDEDFLKNYIKLIFKLLRKKKSLAEIKMVYIGGYEKEENINTAKLYFRALNFYFKNICGEELRIENLKIIDESSLQDAKDALEEMDLLFLGIGDDQKFGNLLSLISENQINIKAYIERNNALVISSCAGSVVSAKQIYGSKYDSFYHDREVFVYPDNYDGMAINSFTMEPNLYPIGKNEEENLAFKNSCLLPDSYKRCFYGCRANSYILMSGNIGYGVGEIYLFLDGIDYQICSENRMVNITYLNELVKKYNRSKSENVKKEIINEIRKLRSGVMDNILDNDATYNFQTAERGKNEENKRRIVDLEIKIMDDLRRLFYGSYCIENKYQNIDVDLLTALNLESDSDFEVFLKMGLVDIVSKYARFDDLNRYFKDLYEIIEKIAQSDSLIVYYFINCFSSMYENSAVKRLLKLTGLELKQKVNVMSTNNKLLWRYLNVA